MAEAYTGPPMKFLKPGELSGSYSPQQMQAMGFKQSANGAWYIPMSTWQRLVSGGQIREGAPAVKNVVVPPPATSDILFGRVPAGPDQITHAYRNMSPAELQHALETGHFQANPNPGRTPGWSPKEKFWSPGDEQGHFGRDWKNADDKVRVRVPIDRVPANTAVDASHAQVLDKTTGRWTAVMPRSSAATAATPRSSSAATRLSRLGGADDVNTFGFGSPAIDQQYIEDLKKEIAKNPGDPYNKNFQDEIDRIQKNMATTQLMREGANGPLASMVSQDQAERNEYKQFVQSKAGGDWDKGAQMYSQLKGRPSDDIFGDSANQDRFMKMTFDFDTFTEDDWHNYWLMAQHCDKNRDFQRQALAAIEKYQGQDHQNYHYLADRISCGTTGTQKYGTQNGCNIDSVQENFADGRHPEHKGDSKRHHVPTKSSVSNLRRFAKSHSGRAAQLAHWMANMKSGRAKKKKTNEAVDAQTVTNFNTRVQFALAKIAQNTDPRYPDQKEFVQLIAANKVNIMNGNPSNPAFSSGHDLNMDAEEFHDAPIEVLILVMAHEIGHIIYGHTFQDPKNPNPTVSQEQQEEYDADQFAINIMKRIGITKIPVWTWLRRKKNDLEQFKRDQDAAPPGSWPTYNQRSDQARKMGVELTKANTDQIDQALQHMG